MEIGIDSFVINSSAAPDGGGLTTADRMSNLLEEIECADQAGLHVFGIGEHHRPDFADSAPAVILSAAAGRTQRIRLTSAVTVLSAHDPVRVFQDFATLDLVSKGRAEMIVGRGSFVDAYPLFGLSLDDYDSLFTEKLELLLRIRENPMVHWSGKHRPRLTGQGIYPRPIQNPLPVWLGVGGTPESFIRAGVLGLPLMVAIIGGSPERFRPLVDLYRQAGAQAGHPPERLTLGVHAIGYVAENNEQAAEDFAPGYLRSFNEIGKERGWGPTTRAHFNAGASPRGALMVGDPETVAKKILSYDAELGGISRMTFQMSVASLPHDQALNSIRLIGKEVIPLLKGTHSEV
ncbi:LLM class flavin-dependent oxidoreductase [Luteolibacter sp. GHJ8]|uniref:LLM class flavin-dependent oxidoreductase n=1 Tax=Luteolibacter rhizosphaerae TaxID=2989719 RepID=A0ABT3FYP7_9BACT|nr:LLM class flavin-dependent oxidoreductase [Luteolibacter rhizosphaerae]MCW1912444.1 LLM class flavin-dependent oxidoreductase [Luteolibacter rhizosphaerae]